MNNLSSYLPSFLENSSVFQQDFNSKNKEFEVLENKIKDLDKQLSINTATWGLSIYEKELDIKTDLNKSVEDRRAVVKSKWRSNNGKIDWKLIKMVADAYTNGQVDVSFDGKIHIKFNSVFGIPPNLEDLKMTLEEIKPAVLRIIYDFAYLLIKNVNEVLTIEELEKTALGNFAGGDIDG